MTSDQDYEMRQAANLILKVYSLLVGNEEFKQPGLLAEVKTIHTKLDEVIAKRYDEELKQVKIELEKTRVETIKNSRKLLLYSGIGAGIFISAQAIEFLLKFSK